MVSTSRVTREVLDGYLRCKTKGFLTLAGRDGIKSDYERWCIEAEERQRLLGSCIAHAVVAWPPIETVDTQSR